MVDIHFRWVRNLSIILLALPVLVFFLLWLRPLVAIPASLMLCAATFMALKTEDHVISVKISHLVIIALMVFVWLIVSGQGRFYAQTGDHYSRNAIFKDMINYRWPVRYPGENDESLVYYIGYWIMPGAIGKVAVGIAGFEKGYLIARISLLLQSFLFIYLSILLICFKLKQSKLKGLLIIATVFIFFSGMDAIGNMNIDFQMEKWAALFVYSSMSTQLVDVFNQCVPAWLATAIVINEKNEKSYALIGLLLLSTSPLPLMGLACYLLYRAVRNLVVDYKQGQLVDRIKTIASPTNILAVISLLPIFWIYYDNNIAIESGVTVSVTDHYFSESSPLIVPMYIAFVLLEFGLLLLTVAKKEHLGECIFIGASLLVIPFFHVGWSTDFCMRVSVPILFLLMVMLMEFFIDGYEPKDKLKYYLAVVIFAIGSFTALAQYAHLTKILIDSHGQAVTWNDGATGLGEMDLGAKGNFVGVNSADTNFYKYLARK